MRCFRQSLRAHTLTLEALESRKLLAATPQLLADINPESSGYPQNFAEFGGRLYYTAMDAEHGEELWSSDGTPEGTHLVKDINPGALSSAGANFVASGSYLYFTAAMPGLSFRLWRTDGTESGTQMVHEIGVGNFSGVRWSGDVVELNGSIYFIGRSNSSGLDLWKSDGTSAGTVTVKDLAVPLAGNVSQLTVVGNDLFLVSSDATGKKLWKSDGTTGGTSIVKDFGATELSGDALLTNFGGTLYFRASDATSTDALWKSDGTSAGTLKLASGDNNFLMGTESLTVVGDRLYFAANTGATGNELWSTDGTAAGTQIVADLAAGSESFAPSKLLAIGETLYFTGTRGGIGELWGLDTATTSTQRLAALVKNDLPLEVHAMAEFEGELYFATHSDVFGTDLWKSDGTELGTNLWRDHIAPAPSTYAEMRAVLGRLFFTANIGGTGTELWSTDGSAGGAQLMADIVWPQNNGSESRDYLTAGDFVYFTANDGTGRHLFSTPGPNGPVTRLTTSAFEMQSADVEQLVPVGNQLYFVARDANGKQYLGVTNGTQQTTQSLTWPSDVDQAEIEGLTQFESGVMFLAHDDTLGTFVGKAGAGGIEIVVTLGPGWELPGQPEAIVAQGVYYFVAEGVAGELWRSDGTAAGTWRVRDAVPTLGLNPTQLTATESSLYFISQGATPTLWKTDGTPEGTLEFASAPAPDKLIAAGDKLYFRTTALPPGPNGSPQLWVSDGTLAGTTFLTYYRDPGSADIRPRPAAAAFGDHLYYFAGPSPGGTSRLMRTDGTTQGTSVFLPEVNIVSFEIVALGDKLYVNTGLMLLESDGTSAGTRALIVSDLFSPFLDPAGLSLTKLGDTLYLSAGDRNSETYLEPHTLTPAPSSIVGRHLYYFNSQFYYSDGQAIATDKTPYFAGDGLATFDSISSYSRGINGIMIDIAGRIPDGLLGNLSAKDFQFRVGASDDPSSWTTAPAPQTIWKAEMSGEGGDFTRVSFIWAEGAIKNTWLEITVLANGRTGLFQPDTFYFGSRIGDTGLNMPAGSFTTTAADELAVRSNTAPQQAVTSLYDFNRDGDVTSADQLIARSNAGLTRRLNLASPLNLAGPLVAAALVEQDDTTDAIASALAVPSAAQPLVAASLTSLPLVSAPLPAVVTSAADREVRHDRGISAALAQQWLKLASESLEDSPLEASLLDVLTAARARRGVRG